VTGVLSFTLDISTEIRQILRSCESCRYAECLSAAPLLMAKFVHTVFVMRVFSLFAILFLLSDMEPELSLALDVPL